MVKLSPEICFKIKQARRNAKLSQSEVAAEVGCKQSALSMFEQGDGTKLNDEVINRLAEKFSITLTDEASEEQPPLPVRVTPAVASKVHGYCPNPHCPTNQTYEVSGRLFVLPNRMMADPISGKFCARCGEVLEKCCPNCGAPVHEGAICSLCGEPYVALS